MIAHKRKKDGAEQSIEAHSRQVAQLCEGSMKRLGLPKLGYCVGILHDLGKDTKKWQRYIEDHNNDKPSAIKGEVHHAPTGAIFAYTRWFHGSFSERTTAQLLAMCIYGHHSGLMDAFSIDGASPLLEKLSRSKDELCYDEAVENFLREVCTLEELDGLFRQAAEELAGLQKRLNEFTAGLLLRTLLGALVDADRWDSACFEYDEDPLAEPPPPDWNAAATALERTLKSFPPVARLAALRAEIADACLAAASRAPGILTLTVPTGGGKTLASLRFSLRHASERQRRRIFYIIPFNTILEQNAEDIRQALDRTVSILEHHSNVAFEESAPPNELEDYKKLTERWQSDVVLTSMVQFLNAFYSGSNTDARRLCGLFDSVIIFDEVQALPKKCVRLFEKAVGFLKDFCGCTVVLCTATQPQLVLDTAEIIPDPPQLFAALRRTELIDETQIARSTERAAEDVLALLQQYGAVLMIVNTKRMARRMYALVRQSGIRCVHLSTDMYPEHRLRLIKEIKRRAGGQPFFCISTALIEAGVNISFPCVVRSLAGLGSALQAAGRCNRDGELPPGTLGKVYLWRLAEESLRGLPEIETAQGCTLGLLAARGAAAANTPESIAAYYALERDAFQSLLPYPAKADGVPVTLLDILGHNGLLPRTEAKRLPLHGAYRTAERLFRVISSDTVPVLVSHGRGETLAAELAANPSMDQTMRLLREAQRYSLSLYTNVFWSLYSEGAIWTIEDAGVYVLRQEYYDDDTGLTREAQIMVDQQY